MNLYLVVQEGVYRHDIRGVYTSAARAETAARRAAREDEDDYHQYCVYNTTANEYVTDVGPEEGAPSFRGERPPPKPGPTAADITAALRGLERESK